MELSQFILFVSASLALIAVPGPDMIYVLTRGVAGGKSVGMLSAAGVTVGILAHTLLAAFGLAALFQTSPLTFTLVKTAGAAYLVVLGIRTFISSGRHSAPKGTSEHAERHHTTFWQGVLTNVLNPKVALFFLAFLPQFVSSATGSLAGQMVLLGSGFAAMTLLLYGMLGYSAGRVGSWLKSHPKVEARMHQFSGLILVGLGARLVLLQQK